jgi:hypothetical protein
MTTLLRLVALSAALLSSPAQAVTFTVPSRAGTGGLTYAPVSPAPVGISFEFFAFPSYFTNVTATKQCLSNWRDLAGGVWPPIRIGGTTQDRASFDPNTSAYVVYRVANPADAPMELTFGPRFMTLAGTYEGSVVMGLNRGKNNIDNTIAAARAAVAEVKNLLAIELGNEPECKRGPYPWIRMRNQSSSLVHSHPVLYTDYPKDGQPLGRGVWNAATDAASQLDWAVRVGRAVNRTNLIQAGNRLQSPPGWGAAQIASLEDANSRQYVRHYAHHNYPGGNVQQLQSHSRTASYVRNMFAADSQAVRRLTGKEYVIGETNSGAYW